MRIPGSGRISSIPRKIQKKFARSKGLILMYHRVADAEMDPWSLSVSPQHFAEQLSVLNEQYQPLSLGQLTEAHAANNIPQKAMAITFDDGYLDNLQQAKPLLERHHTPATVFVVTGALGTVHGFWWDSLEKLILRPGRLPEQLTLTIESLDAGGGQIPREYHWNLRNAAEYSSQDYQHDRKAKADEAKPGSRLFFYYSLWQTLLPLSDSSRQKALNDIVRWAEVPLSSAIHRRALTRAELVELNQGDLIEIGAHTVNHPLLSTQDLAQQRMEIRQSKADLEKILGQSISSFSYPFGDRSNETVSIAQEAGFERACTTAEDIVWQRSDLFQLPRFCVQDWDGETFSRQLKSWFDD